MFSQAKISIAKAKLRMVGLVLIILVLLSSCTAEEKLKIGVIVPVENQSLNEMIRGFAASLKNQLSQPYKIKIANAQADFNLQHTILLQMKNDGYDLIVPIGTAATQMALSQIHEQPIVSLAANVSQKDREALKPCNIAVVRDEISPRAIIQFIHQANPQLREITLIHSASDKIYEDVKIAVNTAHALGIHIQPLLVPTLNDLYSAANAIPKNSEGILILKDLLIASGISTLLNVAHQRHLPLIAADEGSVQNGASFALGVSEQSIGERGARMAAAILAGKPACDVPIQQMNNFSIFVNATLDQKLRDRVVQAATRMHYQINLVSPEHAG